MIWKNWMPQFTVCENVTSVKKNNSYLYLSWSERNSSLHFVLLFVKDLQYINIYIFIYSIYTFPDTSFTKKGDILHNCALFSEILLWNETVILKNNSDDKFLDIYHLPSAYWNWKIMTLFKKWFFSTYFPHFLHREKR